MDTTIFLSIEIPFYFLLNFYVYNRIQKAYYASEERRALHKRFIWFVPFVGPLLIRGFWKKKKDDSLEIITKEDRKRDNANFHESGKGVYGGL